MISVGPKKGRLVRGHIPGVGTRGAAVNAVMSVGLENQMEVRLPHFHILRLVARSLLALALVSFHLLRSSLHQAPVAAAAVAATTSRIPLRQIDDAFLLPMLFRDLKRQGLFPPGGRAMFLGRAAGVRLSHILRQNEMELVTGCESGGRCGGMIPDGTLDFVFSDVGFHDAKFIDRVLKTGGVAAVRLSSDLAGDYRLASNYKIVYVRKFGCTVVAMRKSVEQSQNAVTSGWRWRRRRLLAVPEGTKKEALKGLEDALLEPPVGRMARVRYLKRTKYLPDLTGDTLDDYPRRVFVEVATGSQRKSGAAAGGEVGGDAKWFARNYPTRNRNFEIIRVEVMTEKAAAAAAGTRETAEGEEEEISGWLRRNVGEEEYVVMKAEAGVVEGMVRSGAVGLVDELFLECRHGGREAGPRRRAYWECLALYGRLRDAGVAVHQWWG